MRILWVKVGGLWPLDTGGRLRSFYTISELARRHRVSLLTTHRPTDDPEGLAARLSGCERVISVPYANPKRGSAGFALALLGSWLSPFPVDVWKWRVPTLGKEVARLLERREVDLCVADFLVTTPNVPLGGPVPVVLFAHNADHILWKRLSHNESWRWRRLFLEVEWRKMRRYEAKACRQANLTIAVSDVDRALLASIAPDAKVCAIPTGVDTTYFSPNGTPERPTALVFTGAMDWYPNEDAILYFIEAILPLIRVLVPDVSVSVVGRNPTQRLRDKAAKTGVHVTGTVEDVRPYITEASVYVVPLRVGGGTRLKIYEALAMGKAVVSTRVGAEGLPLVPGTHFLQADGPTEFAHAVASLLRDPARRKALGGAGRRLVVERYSWAQAAREFETLCMEAAGTASPGHARPEE